MPAPESTTSCAANLSEVLLNSYLDKNISEICSHGYADASLNHCAHFVSRVSNYSATPDEFKRHYRGQRNGLYFGTFPGRAQLSSWGCGR